MSNHPDWSPLAFPETLESLDLTPEEVSSVSRVSKRRIILSLTDGSALRVYDLDRFNR